MRKWLEHRPDSVRDWLLLIAAGALVYTALQNLNAVMAGVVRVLGILSPFAGAIVLAYLLDLLARFFAAKLCGGRRGPAIFLAYAVLLLGVVLLVSLVVPQLTSSIEMFAASLPTYMENTQALLLNLQARFGIDVTGISTALQNSGEMMKKLGDLVAQSMPQVAGAVAGAAGNVVSLFTAIAGSIYMLSSKEKLLHGLRALTSALLPPANAKRVFRVFHLANKTFSSYITGQMTDALLVGLETFVLMSVLGLHFAPLISVLVGVTNIIPIFGPFIGAVPSALILLFADPLQALEFVVLILVIQQIDGNFIAPRILGDAIGVSGLWVLFAIVVGGDLFGLGGMVVGVPVFAVAYTLLRQFVTKTLAEKGVDANGDPVPALQATPPAPATPPKAAGGKK
ncbi:MAG: AI-2E family transporter [Gemmiger sp.]|nr:AI-2E family transporter [Gemmiger sp.]